MRSARPGGTPLVIELVGLPGAGKTSLTHRIPVPHLGRRDISSLRLPLNRATWHVLRSAVALSFTIRPWKPSYFLRAVKLVLALRCYGESEHPLVIMDQGLVQKLWSMVIETRSYSVDRLEDLVLALSPFAADHLVWISVPHELAARRIVERKGGNSRFDGQAYESVVQRLDTLEDVYRNIIGLFRRHIPLGLMELDGEAPLDLNAGRIADLFPVHPGARSAS